MYKEARRQFYLDVTGKAATEAARMLEELIGEEVTSDKWSEDGTFLPLSVYATQGYDIDKIRDNSDPRDIREHAVLGLTYRVHLSSTAFSGSRNQVRRSSTKATPPAKASQPALPSTPQVLAIEDGNPDDDGSDSSTSASDSSSSSSSSGHKKKSRKDKKRSRKSKKSRKHKKDKKEKKEKKEIDSAQSRKAKEAYLRAKEKEEMKHHAANVKNAEQVLAKLGPTTEHLESMVAQDPNSLVAPMIRDPVTSALEKFLNLMAAARRCIKSNGKDNSGVPDAKSLSSDVAVVKKSIALMTTVLATMAKASNR